MHEDISLSLILFKSYFIYFVIFMVAAWYSAILYIQENPKAL